MKNLKNQFKLIICILLFLNTFNILTAKNIGESYDTKGITNYFSGILAINDTQYQKSRGGLVNFSGVCLNIEVISPIIRQDENHDNRKSQISNQKDIR